MERFVFQPLFFRGHVKLPGNKQTTKPFINALVKDSPNFNCKNFGEMLGTRHSWWFPPRDSNRGTHQNPKPLSFSGKKHYGIHNRPSPKPPSLTAIKETNANYRDIPVDSTVVRCDQLEIAFIVAFAHHTPSQYLKLTG